MMVKKFLPRLIVWFFKNLFISLLISFVICYFIIRLFTDLSFSENLNFILFGFLIASLFSALLFFRLLLPLSRLSQRLHWMARGRFKTNTSEDFYLSEPGEFYDINKNLNTISDDLTLKKTIIKQESSELEAVIAAVSGAILAIDYSQRVLFFNNEAITLFAPDKKINRLKNIYASEIIRNPQILDMYNECLKTGKVIKKTLAIGDSFSMEKEVIYEITIAPLEGAQNKTVGAVALFYDVTNMKKIEKIQTDFMSNVSHELRTPLTAIQGYVQNLLSGLDNNTKETTEQFLKVINRNAERLVSLLNNFLEFSYIDNQSSLQKEEISTEKITKSIIKDLHVKDREIKYDFSAKTVKADPMLLNQVLYNLLDNAIKYTDRGLIEVIWKKNNDGEDPAVILTVKDQGKGIPLSQQDRMFERFYRADPSRTKIKGTGLGLSIVKQLIVKHGGSIKIESDGSHGSAFICRFPD